MRSPEDAPEPPEAPRNQRAGWRSGRALQIGVMTVVAITLLALLGQRLYAAQQVVGAGATTAANGARRATALKVAPDFTLHTWSWEQSHATGVDPQQMRLLALRGKPVVINFWASWCDACKTEAPTLERAWRTYQARGVVFLGIDVNDTATDSATFLTQYGITYFNGPDVTERIFVQYGVFGLPTTVLVNQNGDIQTTHIGEISASALDQGIQSLLR